MIRDPVPPMDPSDPPVAHILDRAARLSSSEAALLDVAVRRNAGAGLTARRALDAHQRFLNATAMFDHWPDPAVEMMEARRRVAVALGVPLRPFDPIEQDDGSVLWGASTATAYGVLGSGRAASSAELRAAWEEVIGEQPEHPPGASPHLARYPARRLRPPPDSPRCQHPMRRAGAASRTGAPGSGSRSRNALLTLSCVSHQEAGARHSALDSGRHCGISRSGGTAPARTAALRMRPRER